MNKAPVGTEENTFEEKQFLKLDLVFVLHVITLLLITEASGILHTHNTIMFMISSSYLIPACRYLLEFLLNNTHYRVLSASGQIPAD